MSDVSDDSYGQLNSIFSCVPSDRKKLTGSGREARAYTTTCTPDVLVRRAGSAT